MIDESLYEGREQTYVKHYILSEYLALFAQIIGRYWNKINYIDCFAGPWEARSPDLRDTSFAIAVEQFRDARQKLAQFGRNVIFRCFFLEGEPQSYRRLKQFADGVTDIEIKTVNRKLEQSIDDILNFIREGGPGAFSFIFIDPTGWSGFAMEKIRPLLEVRPGEVLINFMTGFIKRFVEAPSEQTTESFIAMFGEDIREEIKGLSSLDREERLVRLYMRNVKRAGGFEYLSTAIVFKPGIESTHFHLIYATRNSKGVEVFKNVEKRAMRQMDNVRAASKQRTETERTRQMSLLAPNESHASRERVERRLRYERMASDRVWSIIERDRRVLYDRLWKVVIPFPLVNDTTLNEWLANWNQAGRIDFEGLTSKQKNPRRESGNYIVWKR
jgi:three-Cys-motif partner protein